jgi:quercetin dioxygenase-like cupin family protein
MTLKNSVRMKRCGAIAALVFMAPSALAQTYPPAYPRPNATKFIDNDRVNVLEVYWPKGQPTPLHTHTIDQFSITLRGGLLRVGTADGKWGEAHMSQVASVNFVPAGTTHREEGMSEVPQHKIMLEVKPSPLHPDAHGTSPGDGAVKVFENNRLVAWDLSWKPGMRISRPAQTLDTVTVFIDGGTIRVADPTAPADITWRAGEAIYAPHGTPARAETLTLGTPRAIIVELK